MLKMKKSKSFEPKQYIKDDGVLKIFAVVTDWQMAMATNAWSTRVYPQYKLEFITQDRYNTKKEEVND